ncbi:hypothetical protein EVAR_67475_1 [Eumeta japonica]|uniref:Uncharacterized protein n=1 Tax=Eumeta variegata TaxID=151549 RepID=A0A4C1ZC05_EUMVA|nr:hypothetical protein EVAR_67475_1 [Eumeta japonica]
MLVRLRAALAQGMTGVVSGWRRARPAPGHAATEHPAPHHLDVVRAPPAGWSARPRTRALARARASTRGTAPHARAHTPAHRTQTLHFATDHFLLFFTSPLKFVAFNCKTFKIYVLRGLELT